MPAIIALCGLPGSGKSTLAYHLARQFSGCVLEYDYYQTITRHSVETIKKVLSKDSDYNALHIPGLAEDLRRLKRGIPVIPPGHHHPIPSRDLIFFETPFGYCHRDSAQFIDLMLWLDIPPDIALARNIKAFVEQFSGSQSSRYQWLQDYLSNYITLVHDLLSEQEKTVRPEADYVINGHTDLDTVCAQAIKQIQEWTSRQRQPENVHP